MIGVVVIGRNEGYKLQRCLESLLPLACPIVYADSCSSDGSVMRAETLGVAVAQLDPSRPMNASRGRKEGFERLLAEYSELEYVFFVDGDCEINPSFFPVALQILAQRSDVAAVCGLLIELHPGVSIYNRIANLEWKAAVGECASCAGIALIRVSAYLKAGGFNETVLAGEEPELCARIRRQGYKVLRIDEVMAWHDLNMHHLSQWWRRGVRSGYGALDVRLRFGVRDFDKLLVSSWVWVLGWPLFSSAVLFGFWQDDALTVWVGLLLLTLLPLQVLRIARSAYQRGLTNLDSLAYGALMMVNKLSCVWGQIIWLLRKR